MNDELKASAVTTILQIEPGISVEIVDIAGGEGTRRRLFSLGLHVGDRIEVAGRGILRGPVLVRHAGSGITVAIGRGIAQKILVKV
jgi:Fe2+ transport system protein FeoA